MKKSYRAGAIVINNENKIALANEHLWGFPRGGVEENEDYLTAAKREVLEEVGLEQFESIEELGVYDRYPNGITEDTPGAYPMEIHMFLFKTNYKGALNPRDELVKEAVWFSYEKALERLTDGKDKEFLEKYWEKILESQAE
jgi:ADP-ribose pyrophosphatase YjhB (NUDIX family)